MMTKQMSHKEYNKIGEYFDAICDLYDQVPPPGLLEMMINAKFGAGSFGRFIAKLG